MEIQTLVKKAFRQLAKQKALEFVVHLDSNLPVTIKTDKKRLQQIIKNLLSNAFKFTEKGSVHLEIFRAKQGWSQDNELLNNAGEVIGFAVKDTGIGIQEDKRRLIFEAFQQADGTTSRKYGGTGLGLPSAEKLHDFWVEKLFWKVYMAKAARLHFILRKVMLASEHSIKQIRSPLDLH